MKRFSLISLMSICGLFIVGYTQAYTPTTMDDMLIASVEKRVAMIAEKKPEKLPVIAERIEKVMPKLPEDSRAYFFVSVLYKHVLDAMETPEDDVATMLAGLLGDDNAMRAKNYEENRKEKHKEKKEMKEEIKNEKEEMKKEIKNEKEKMKKEKIDDSDDDNDDSDDDNDDSDDDNDDSDDDKMSDGTRVYNNSVCDHTYYRGPQGGCYYINSNDTKTYDTSKDCCEDK